ncbi:MAG TPA: thiamine phosphate synthase [Dehalococcoidales bacterium]|nr:thiamine phosphate synthase [Dehalococcoidales bacterium]
MASPELNTLRIIDANLNRIGEGLRLLEELARMILNDVNLTQQLKTMRHQILETDKRFNQRLLQARDSEGDVGINLEAAQKKERELPNILVANSRRVQESLRTIEELAKIPETGLDTEKFKKARFDLYTIERNLLSRLLRQDKLKRLSGLYVIVDTQALLKCRHTDVAKAAIAGGARVIQLRDKISTKKELLPIAEQLKQLCAEHDVLFIINDHLDLLLAVDADGLHLGQDDLPIKTTRRLLPVDKILGISTRTVDGAVAAQAEGADYIAVGAMYPTPSKQAAQVVGVERLSQVRQAVTLPLVAIGGINQENAAAVMAAGADSIAVIRAVVRAQAPEKAAREIVNIIEASKTS